MTRFVVGDDRSQSTLFPERLSANNGSRTNSPNKRQPEDGSQFKPDDGLRTINARLPPIRRPLAFVPHVRALLR
jgi:hypothetical protein